MCEEIDIKTTSSLRLCLANNIFFNIIEEEIMVELCEKLERLYMTKSIKKKALPEATTI